MVARLLVKFLLIFLLAAVILFISSIPEAYAPGNIRIAYYFVSISFILAIFILT